MVMAPDVPEWKISSAKLGLLVVVPIFVVPLNCAAVALRVPPAVSNPVDVIVPAVSRPVDVTVPAVSRPEDAIVPP